MVSSHQESVTQRIRDAVDIVDVIGSYVTLKRAGAAFKGLCPFHDEKTPSFTVNPTRQTFKCFGCNVGGDVFTFLMEREKVDFLEARRLLADRVGINVDPPVASSEAPGGARGARGAGSRGGRSGPGKTDLMKVNEWGLEYFRAQLASPVGNDARGYIERRQIAPDQAETFQLGYAPDRFDGLLEAARKARLDLRLLLAAGLLKQSDGGRVYDTFRNRLMFPIRDVTGRVIAFGGRTLGDDPAKYLNTPATMLFDKSANLFGIDRAKHPAGQLGRIIVVEGYTDCMMAHQFGFGETVATLGTAMTDQHGKLLKRFADRVILVFDSDEAGQKAADRAISVTLTQGLDVSLAAVPQGKDPCDYLLVSGKNAFESLLKGATSALEFKWQQVTRDYHASESGPGRRRAIDAFLQDMARWVGQGAIDPIQKGLLVNQLAKILGVPGEEIHRQLQRLVRRMTRPTSPRAGTADGSGYGASGYGASGDRASGDRASGDGASGDGASGDGAHDPELVPTAGGPWVELVAYRQILEALLNEPSCFDRAASILKNASIPDAGLARIAEELVAELEMREPFRLDVFIGRFASPTLAARVMDLQCAGERYAMPTDPAEAEKASAEGRRELYEQVIDGAVVCLERCREIRLIGELAEQISQERRVPNGPADGSGPGDDEVHNACPEGEDERLRALAARLRQPHFSPNRVRRQFLRG